MRILIVDDEKLFLSAIAEFLRSEGFEVVTADNGLVGSKFAGLHAFDLVITDILMPEMDGVEMIAALRKKLPQIPVIAMTGSGSFEDLEAILGSKKLGVTFLIHKPFRLEQLSDLIHRALQQSARLKKRDDQT